MATHERVTGITDPRTMRVVIDKEFDAIAQRYGRVEKVLAQSKDLLSRVEKQVYDLYLRIGNSSVDLTALEARVAAVEGGVASLNSRVSAAESAITSIDGRLSSAESQIVSLGSRVSAAESSILAIDGRVAATELAIVSLDSRLDSAEGNISALDGRVSAAESSITTLTFLVDNLGANLGILSNRVDAIDIEIINIKNRLTDTETELGALNTYYSTSGKLRITPEGGIAIRLTNKTGGLSVRGRCVDVDTVTSSAVKYSDTDSTPLVVGIVYEDDIPDGQEVWVVVQGIADVFFLASGLKGNQAKANLSDESSGLFCEVGRLLEDVVAPGRAKVLLSINS